MLKEFKSFALKGNVMDLAVGFILGAAFGAVVNSTVADVIMPPLGMLLSNVDFSNLYVVIKEGATAGPYATLAAAKAAGAVTINIGLFLNTLLSFVITAFAVFILVKAISKLKKKEEEKPSAPAAPPREEVLLTEIRDLLKSRS